MEEECLWVGGEKRQAQRKGKRGREKGREEGRREERKGEGMAHPGKSGTDSKVMVDDWYKVFGQLHVKLHIVSSMRSCLPERRYRVLCCRWLAAIQTPMNQIFLTKADLAVINCI